MHGRQQETKGRLGIMSNRKLVQINARSIRPRQNLLKKWGNNQQIYLKLETDVHDIA